MVFILDEGSVFDAPVDKVWKYLPSEAHRHNSMKLLGREMVDGNAVVITGERTIQGKTVRTKIKNTLYPPLGYAQEHLEGPTAGSRAFVFYTPKGNKTAITVVGDFVLSGIDEKATRAAVMAQLQITFDEDNANLKNIKQT
jgi:hypothetical protein